VITAAEARFITAQDCALQMSRAKEKPWAVPTEDSGPEEGPVEGAFRDAIGVSLDPTREVTDRGEHIVRIEADPMALVSEGPRPRGVSVEPRAEQTAVSVEQLSRVLLDSLDRVNRAVQAMSDVARRVSVTLTQEGRS
jgi:hypothetical protein